MTANTDTPLFFHKGACHNTNTTALFFSDNSAEVAMAKRVCASCQVRTQCEQYAFETGQQHGTWGGLSESDRRRAIRLGKVNGHGKNIVVPRR